MLIESDKVIEQHVRAIVEKNNTISLQLLVDQVSRDLKRVPYLNKKDVEKTIKKMIQDFEIFIGPKPLNDEIIENLDRKLILSYIVQNPSMTLEELSNSLGIHKDKLVWHLTFLEKFQFIKPVKTLFAKKYYPTKKAGGLKNENDK